MAEGFDDLVPSQAPVGNMSDSLAKGMQLNAQMNEARSLLQQRQAEIENQKDQKEVNIMEKIADPKVTNSAKKGLFNFLTEFRKSRGKQTNPDIYPIIKDDQNMKNALADIYAHSGVDQAPPATNDPKALSDYQNSLTNGHKQRASDFISIYDSTQGDITQTLDTLHKYTEQKDKVQQLQSAGQAALGKEAFKASASNLSKTTSQDIPDRETLVSQFKQAGLSDAQANLVADSAIAKAKTNQTQVLDKNKLRTALTDPFKIKALDGSYGPEAQKDAMVEAQQVLAKRGETDFTNKQDLTNAKIENFNNLDDYRNKALALKKQNLDVMKQRLGVQQQGLALRADNQVINNTKTMFENVARADQGLVLLNRPNLKWTDLSESAADLNRIITGSSRVAQTQADKIDFDSFKRDWDTKWYAKITNKEQGGPSQDEVNIFKDRMQRLRDAISANHDKKLNQIANLQSLSGLRNTGYLQQMYDEYKLNPNSAYIPVGQGVSNKTIPGSNTKQSTTARVIGDQPVQALLKVYRGNKEQVKKYLDSKNVQYNGSLLNP